MTYISHILRQTLNRPHQATVMDIYIYPDLWKKLNKSGPKEDEPTVKPNEQGKYKPSDYAKVYETEKVKLADLPIYEKVNGKEVPVLRQLSSPYITAQRSSMRLMPFLQIRS